MTNRKMPRLTRTVQCAGCAAKIGPALLNRLLDELRQERNPNLLVGFEWSDDAAIYKLTDNLALVQTIDFFPPVVDDPYIFGQIAAANALSDVYAMGGKPLTAMNVVAFPVHNMDIGVLKEILKGGVQKLNEAGVSLVGGHSIEDKEIKYGLSVTGIINPGKIITNQGLKPGDNLVLTKPLGTGIINTAVKNGRVDARIVRLAQKSMCVLNRAASEIMLEVGVNACTDVTGFGLLVHLCKMTASSQSGAVINVSDVPIFDGAAGFAQKGLIPGGTLRNRQFCENRIIQNREIPGYLMDILFDPQTSGGLLISVPKQKTGELLRRLKAGNIRAARVIGRVTASPKDQIILS